MMTNLMTILERKAFISSNPRIVLSSCPPPCGHFSIQESATGGLSYKVKRTLPQLENVPFSEYDDIIFISKSIGTTIACQLETALQLKGKVHQFLMTPIPSTLRYLSDINGLFFAGTADPYMPESKIRAAARNFPDKTGGIFEGCNHSLEQKGDTLGALKNVRLIVECLDKMLV